MQDNPKGCVLTPDQCPACGHNITRDAQACPQCGAPPPKPEELGSNVTAKPPSSAVTMIVLFALIAGAFALTLYFYAAILGTPAVQTREVETDIMAGADVSVKRHAEEPFVPATPQIPQSAVDAGPRGVSQSGEPTQRALDREARKERIKLLAEEIFEDLKAREVLSTDTIYLTTGQVLHCTIIEESDSSLKIRSGGVTSLIDRDRIESIESRTVERVDHELQRMALKQAIKIVDEGLVRYGDEWISPEEREQRIHVATTKASIEELEARRRAGLPIPQPTLRPPAPKPVAPKSSGPIDFSKVTVIEGFGFEDIVLGHPRCTEAYLKARLGPPDNERPRMLDYNFKYGLVFVMASNADVLIEMHIGRGFQGKLASDVSMSSTMEDVFDAYGEPIEEINVDNLKESFTSYRNRTLYRKGSGARIFYRDLGLLFWFLGDEINQIVVFRQ